MSRSACCDPAQYLPGFISPSIPPSRLHLSTILPLLFSSNEANKLTSQRGKKERAIFVLLASTLVYTIEQERCFYFFDVIRLRVL